MRLIGSLKTQQEAFIFQKFLKSKGIDLLTDTAQSKTGHEIHLWIVNEEDTKKAEAFLTDYIENPSNPEFYTLPTEPIKEPEYDTSAPKVIQKKPRLPLATWLWIFVSVILFFIQIGQGVALVKQKGQVAAEVELTPIQTALYFDVPTGFSKLAAFIEAHGLKQRSEIKNLSKEEMVEWKSLNETTFFHGFIDMLQDPAYEKSFLEKKMPLFEKIRQGEFYRLLTPVLLHGSVLHIFFNMIWLFILMKQVEIKIGIVKVIIVAALCGVISNVSQYVGSGPFFVGASGVIMGLAAFIWIRQKKAPWEGYALSRGLVFFLLLYVLALVALSIGVFVFNLSTDNDIAFGIANTAHVAGGLTGLALGSSKYFRRS